MKSYAPTKATVVCLVALSLGPLKREGRLWRFGRRFFAAATVKELIDQGWAVREGDEVRLS